MAEERLGARARSFWARRSRKGKAGLITLAIFVGLIILGSAVGGKKSTSGTTTRASAVPVVHHVAARKCSTYSGAKPQTCMSKMGSACDSYDPTGKPADCYTAYQLKVRARVAKAKAAAAAKRHALAVARAKVRAKASAAAYAAANAWHSGYTQQDDNVYWKWINGGSCEEFAQDGCWHVEVITDNGCPSYVAVNANEYQNGTIINSLLDNQGFGIPPRTPRLFELDADTGGTLTAGDVQIDCQ